jgi:hypothetical protein
VAKTLTRELTIDPRKANGVAHIVRDGLHNVYEGCGFDKACNYVPFPVKGLCWAATRRTVRVLSVGGG